METNNGLVQVINGWNVTLWDETLPLFKGTDPWAGRVYVVEVGSIIKIGCSQNLTRRLRELGKLFVDYCEMKSGRVAFSPECTNYYLLEQKLHEHYKKYRRAGTELFAISMDSFLQTAPSLEYQNSSSLLQEQAERRSEFLQKSVKRLAAKGTYRGEDEKGYFIDQETLGRFAYEKACWLLERQVCFGQCENEDFDKSVMVALVNALGDFLFNGNRGRAEMVFWEKFGQETGVSYEKRLEALGRHKGDTDPLPEMLEVLKENEISQAAKAMVEVCLQNGMQVGGILYDYCPGQLLRKAFCACA